MNALVNKTFAFLNNMVRWPVDFGATCGGNDTIRTKLITSASDSYVGGALMFVRAKRS